MEGVAVGVAAHGESQVTPVAFRANNTISAAVRLFKRAQKRRRGLRLPPEAGRTGTPQRPPTTGIVTPAAAFGPLRGSIFCFDSRMST